MTKYRLYVDEVGDTGLKRVNDINHRFLSLTGVIAESDYVRSRIHPELEDIKARYFDSHPDEPVVLHRKELVSAKWPFRALMDPATRVAFGEDFLGLLRSWEYQVVTVCLDKQAFVTVGHAADYDPYHYCLSILAGHFVTWLAQRNATGDVFAEARGSNEDRRLKSHFRTLWSNGTESISSEQFQGSVTNREVKIKSKTDNISCLQLADVIAHPSSREILHEQGLMTRPLGPYAGRVIIILDDKYAISDGIVSGKNFIQ